MTIYDKIAAIQDEVQNITKDAKNPHFGNSYATYEKVMEVLHPILRKHDLVFFHEFRIPAFEGQIAVTTTLKPINVKEKPSNATLASIASIKSWDDELSTTLHIPTAKNDPQAAGSAITYAKRYSILSMLGLGTEDDDGNSGSGRAVVKKTSSVANSNNCQHLNTSNHQATKEGPNKGRWFKVCENCKDKDDKKTFIGWTEAPVTTEPTGKEWEDKLNTIH